MQHRVQYFISFNLSFHFRERKDIGFILRLDFNKMRFFLLFLRSFLEAGLERTNGTYLEQSEQGIKYIWV